MQCGRLLVSTYKSIDNKRKGKKGRKKAASGSAANPRAKTAGNGHMANPADLARGVKSLVEQFGAEAVKDMAGVFAG